MAIIKGIQASIFLLPTKETLGVTPNLKSSLVRSATPYWLLCLYKKLIITTYSRQHEVLNKWSEIFANAVMRITTFRAYDNGQLNILTDGISSIDSMIVYL